MTWLRSVFWEIKLDILSTIRYKFSVLSDIVVFSVMLLFFLYSDTGNSYEESFNYTNYKELMLVGYLGWMYAVSAISVASNTISSELRQGTFYKKLNSKCPLQLLFLGDLFSGELIQTVVAIFLIVVANTFGGVEVSFHPIVFVYILISTVGMYGLGLIIGGISLFLKRTGSILFIVQTCLLFITDSIPTNSYVLNVSKYLPLTICNNLSKNAIIGNVSYYSLIYLLISSIMLFSSGVILFTIFLHFSKKRGNLLFY